jgi:hypothetical protein
MKILQMHASGPGLPGVPIVEWYQDGAQWWLVHHILCGCISVGCILS